MFPTRLHIFAMRCICNCIIPLCTRFQSQLSLFGSVLTDSGPLTASPIKYIAVLPKLMGLHNMYLSSQVFILISCERDTFASQVVCAMKSANCCHKKSGVTSVFFTDTMQLIIVLYLCLALLLIQQIQISTLINVSFRILLVKQSQKQLNASINRLTIDHQ